MTTAPDKHKTQERSLSITNRKFTNRLKITKVLSNSQVKPQDYDPVLSKFCAPSPKREENTVLRGYFHYIPLLTLNVRPNKRPTSKISNLKSEAPAISSSN